MIRMEGELAIKQRDGRRGTFNVGELICDEGKFTVRYNLLDQYDPGVYEGVFFVSNIRSAAISLGSSGRMLIETQVVIQDVQLSNYDESLDSASEFKEPEPEFLDEVDHSETVSASDKSEGEILFGSKWPLGDSFKLDSTEDRSVLAKKIDYLRNNDYTLDHLTQVFHKQ